MLDLGKFAAPARLTEKQKDAAYELHKRRMRDDLIYFAECVLKHEHPDNKLSACHILLLEHLKGVAEGTIKKLLVQMPSGSGKTTLLSRIFPAWLLARKPGLRMIGASHTTQFAQDQVSRRIQTILVNFPELGCQPLDEQKAYWRTTNGGIFRSVGVGSGILGERCHIAIVDDPFGNMADARSEAIRDGVYNWYRSDLTSRLYLGESSICMMHQRVHLDDLCARLLHEEGDEWTVLHLPARFEGLDWRGNQIASDELGRTRIGESIWKEKWSEELLEQRERDMGPIAWASMYQQRPIPPDGTVFLPNNIKPITEGGLPKPKRMVRAWDMAGGATRFADWTVGILMQENAPPYGGWTIVDMVRAHTSADELERLVVQTADMDRQKYSPAPTVWIAIDPGVAGVSLANHLTKALSGHHVVSQRETGSKQVRAMPLASQINAGHVLLVSAPFNRVLLDELAAFPAGRHDDCVDACSSAFNYLNEAKEQARAPQWSYAANLAR